MATEVDICNMALACIGDTATVTSIDPPEGSAQAEHCARFYRQSLSELLASHPWQFATKRVKQAKLVTTPVGEDGFFAYPVPSDCLKLISVESEDYGRDFKLRYDIEIVGNNRCIICGADDVWIRYVTSNAVTGTFPPDFTAALVHRVASYLSGSVNPGASGVEMGKKELELYSVFLKKAQLADARQQFEKEIYRSEFLGDCTQEVKYGYI